LMINDTSNRYRWNFPFLHSTRGLTTLQQPGLLGHDLCFSIILILFRPLLWLTISSPIRISLPLWLLLLPTHPQLIPYSNNHFPKDRPIAWDYLHCSLLKSKYLCHPPKFLCWNLLFAGTFGPCKGGPREWPCHSTSKDKMRSNP
jgi:hypothetical protein